MQFEQIIKPREGKQLIEVDMSDLLGEHVIFKYREPSVADLFAISNETVLSEQRLRYPELPPNLLQTIELIARLHIEPQASSESAIGALYCELLTKTLDAKTAALFIARVVQHVAPFLLDLENELAQKKVAG